MSAKFRLVHISDLHFSNTFQPNKWSPKEWSRKFPGLGGHNVSAVNGLATSILDYCADGDTDWTVVATGDLTAEGQRDSFDLAYNFLRGRHPVRPQSLASEHYAHQKIALNKSAVIPGNHDLWGGYIWGAGQNHAQVRATEFCNPAAGASPPDGFPYRLSLGSGPTPIYLYGLDTTELDADNSGLELVRENLMAKGSVGYGQLKNLRHYVENEPHGKGKALRIAALHHPIAHPETASTDTHLGRFKAALDFQALKNIQDVTSELQSLGFAVVLSGHIHQGFVMQTAILDDTAILDNTAEPLLILSAGTATQQQGRSPAHRNEYRIYDIEVEADHRCYISIHCFHLQGQGSSPAFAWHETKHVDFDLTLYSPR